MKKICFTVLLLISIIVTFGQNKKTVIEGKALYLGVSYAKPIRAEFDNTWPL